MTEEYSDKIHLYLGIVVADKELDSRTIKVTLREVQPNNQNTHATEQAVEVGSDSNTGKRQGQMTVSNFVTAEYFGATNSGFPPDVRENEQVLIYQYGDTNKYYWQSMGLDDNLRRTERTRMQVNATLSNNASLDDDSVYAIELNTRTDKCIKIWTSAANGEEHSYNLTIDAANSKVFLGDDYGNQISIESNTPRITLKNQANSLIDINNQDITMYCENNINLCAKSGQCNIYSGNNMTLATNANMVQQSQGTYDQVSSGAMNVTGTAALTLKTAGAFTITFGAGGTCNGGGGTMHFADTNISVD